MQPNLLPTRKVSVGLLGGAVTTLGFYILTATSIVHPDPPAAVGAAAATVVGAVLAYIIPEKDQAP
jgi:putative flippase GtrA